jgi:hypothetical protein
MSDYPTGGGYGYNWWDTDQYYTDPADPAGGGGDDTADADADTVAVDQQVEDLFEDPDFIAALVQLMEEQNFSLDSLNEEQDLSAWSGANWDTYFKEFFSGQFDPDWWSQYLNQHLGEETVSQIYDEETYDPYHEDDDVGQAPHGAANDGTPLPDPEDYEEGETIVEDTEGRIYRCDFGEDGEKIWTEVKGEGDGVYGGGESEDLDGTPLPNPGEYEEGEGLVRGGGIYVIRDGVWHEVKDEDKDEDKDDDDLPTGIFGGTAGPKIKDWLKGVFGIPESFEEGDTWWQKLLKIYLGGKQFKEGLDAIKYEVPTGQGAAMSAYEKAHPLDIDMGLEGLGPNYLQDQLYGIPIGAEKVPAATHTLGLPYAEEIPVGIEEEVQGGQRGGIMNARSHGDIVPALLEPGEFVMNLQAVKGAGNGDARQGAKNMYKMMRQLEERGQ